MGEETTERDGRSIRVQIWEHDNYDGFIVRIQRPSQLIKSSSIKGLWYYYLTPEEFKEFQRHDKRSLLLDGTRIKFRWDWEFMKIHGYEVF